MVIYKQFLPVTVVQWREGPQNSSCDVLEVCLISTISCSFHRMPCLILDLWLQVAVNGSERSDRKQKAEEENLGGIYVGN